MEPTNLWDYLVKGRFLVRGFESLDDSHLRIDVKDGTGSLSAVGSLYFERRDGVIVNLDDLDVIDAYLLSAREVDGQGHDISGLRAETGASRSLDRRSLTSVVERRVFDDVEVCYRIEVIEGSEVVRAYTSAEYTGSEDKFI
jgi:hypothetical protein